jgi:hypothetical protein
MPREHGKDGAFVETVSLEDVLDVFDAVDGPVILSADVADTLDCSRETARRKLKELHDRGDLDRRKVSRRVIYWRDTPDTVGHSQKARDTPRVDAGDTEGETPDTDTHAAHADESDLVEDVRAYLEEKGVGPKTRRGRDMVCDVLGYLREHDTAKTGELKELLEPEYGEHYKNTKSLWESVSRYLKDVPGVEKGGHGVYRYAGDEHVREELNK